MMWSGSTARSEQSPTIEALAQALSGFAQLSASASQLVSELKAVSSFSAGQLVVAERDRSRPFIVVEGWAARIRWLADGRRQIFDFLLPGDGFGLTPGRHASPVAVMAVTSIDLVDATSLKTAMAQPGLLAEDLKRHLAEQARTEEERLLNQVERLGCHSAYERICHLLLELRERCTGGDPGATEFEMPLTQECMGDVLGLSVVHVNRVLQQLRRDRLLEIRGGSAQLKDLDALQNISEYRRVGRGAQSEGPMVLRPAAWPVG
ncbi:Crp/Fnr family transcriptional regulator [Phenylobacterium sp. LjRoot164]|uniref:Crp/Fnr family transcriptional regulator n=1 Tax=unclassified Phenylobacterium TaxID=2640670 RepID=UPI003ED02508